MPFVVLLSFFFCVPFSIAEPAVSMLVAELCRPLCFQCNHRQDMQLALKKLCESNSYLKAYLPRKGVITVSLYTL